MSRLPSHLMGHDHNLGMTDYDIYNFLLNLNVTVYVLFIFCEINCFSDTIRNMKIPVLEQHILVLQINKLKFKVNSKFGDIFS